MIALAGHAAESRFTGRNNIAEARADFSTAADALSHLCGDEDETSAYLNLMTIKTRNSLSRPENWPLVQRLAAALLAGRTVRYQAAKEMAGLARRDIVQMSQEELERMYDEAEAHRTRKATKKGRAK
jgi:hypothetical protein